MNAPVELMLTTRPVPIVVGAVMNRTRILVGRRGRRCSMASSQIGPRGAYYSRATSSRQEKFLLRHGHSSRPACGESAKPCFRADNYLFLRPTASSDSVGNVTLRPHEWDLPQKEMRRLLENGVRRLTWLETLLAGVPTRCWSAWHC